VAEIGGAMKALAVAAGLQVITAMMAESVTTPARPERAGPANRTGSQTGTRPGPVRSFRGGRRAGLVVARHRHCDAER
jgi:hypothetical protein